MVLFIDTPVQWNAAMLSPGDKCDIQDSENIWHAGEVITSGTNKDHVRVSILNSSIPRNLTLPRSSPRLATAGAHTSQRNGALTLEQGSKCDSLTKESLQFLQLQKV